MKAQVFRGVNQLSYEELPVPAIAPDEVLGTGSGLVSVGYQKNPLYDTAHLWA